MTPSERINMCLSAIVLIAMASFIHANSDNKTTPVAPPVPEGYNPTPLFSKNETSNGKNLCRGGKGSNDTGCTDYALNEFTAYCEFNFQGNNFTNITERRCVSNTSCNAIVTCADPKNIATLECHQITDGNETLCNCFVYGKK